jgi:hypothetical protein
MRTKILVLSLMLLALATRTGTAQVILCPPDMTVSNDPGVCSAVVNFPAPSIDTTNLGVVVTCDPPSGTAFPVGTNDVTCVLSQVDTNLASCGFTIVVNDTEPPVITNVSLSPSFLWPPNHKMVKVAVNYQVQDNCDLAPACTLSVASNEPVNGRGDGSTSPDWQVLNAHHVMLRAERSGLGSGRTYTITITAVDNSGNSNSVDTAVCVPHDRGKKSDCSDTTPVGKGNEKAKGNGKGQNGKSGS